MIDPKNQAFVDDLRALFGMQPLYANELRVRGTPRGGWVEAPARTFRRELARRIVAERGVRTW